MAKPLAGWRSAGWALLVLAVVLYLAISALTLAKLGIPYDLPGGSPLVKLHPGTWVLLLASLLALADNGHPLAVLFRSLRQVPALATYLGCMGFVAVWAVWRNGTSGAAFIVDTLWMPGLAWLVLLQYGPARHRRLLGGMLVLLGLNALIALAEFGVKAPLVPRYALDESLVPDAGYFRSSALLGHPLANALVTVSLMPAAMLLHGWRRWGLLLLLGLSLLAFGSRTALAVMLLVYLSALLAMLALRAARGRYSYLQLTGGLLAMMLVATAAVAMVWLSGLGERIFANLTWDNSANVRLVALQALQHLDDFDWWIGVPPARIEEIALRLGLDLRFETIENFWVVLLMQFGLVGFVPFLLGLFVAMVHLWRRAAPPMRLALPVYLLVASGANTLASKSVSLTLLFVAALASAAWAAPARAAGPVPPGRAGWALSPGAGWVR
jgi:hypothetical protein